MRTQLSGPAVHGIGSALARSDVIPPRPDHGPLLAVAAAAGRWPVWITAGGLQRVAPPADPAAVVSRIDDVDPAVELARRWPGADPGLAEWRAPFGSEFPGLVAGREPADEPLPTEPVVELGQAHLALVPVSRPADTVAALGWSGAINYGENPAVLSAVLRSWEDRFDAHLVLFDAATLWVSVAAPPWSERDCLGVAAEHFSFCCDVDGEDPRPLARYSADLRGRRCWRFWWD